MQEIRETYRGHETLDRLVGHAGRELHKQFKDRYHEAVERINAAIESGDSSARLEVHETRGIGRNDPCPCGSKEKFKRCCGKRLAANDERVA